MDYNNQKYAISLDAVDLNLMPINLKRSYDSVIPIWTKSNLDLRDDDYYEFEIRNEENLKDLQTDKSSNMHVMCHICNLRVPNVFINEHNLSARHEINMKIVNISLNKVKEAINMPVVVHKEKDQNVFFCTSCVTTVNVKDKMAHDSTVAHINSENIISMMRNFLILFSHNDNNEDNVYKCDKETTNRRNEHILTQNETAKPNDLDDLFHKLIKAKRSCQNDCDKSNNFEQKSEGIIQDNLNILHSNKKQSLENKNDDLDNKNNLEMYIDVLIKSNKLKMPVKVLDENNLEIVTPDGKCLKISENNFHSFKNMDDEHLLCLLCQEVIETQKKKEHIFCKLHMERVCVPFTDQHCVRQINNSWGHCILCNKQSINRDMHILCNEDHERYLKEASKSIIGSQSFTKIISEDNTLLNNENLSKTTDKELDVGLRESTNKFDDEISVPHEISVKLLECNLIDHNIKYKDINYKYCDICEMYIDNINHANSKKHIINEEVKNSKIHYLMEANDVDSLKCKVCLCFITKDPDVVNCHIKSDTHIKKYKCLLAENNIVDNNNCILYCKFCKRSFTKINVISHINGTDHKNNMSEALSLCRDATTKSLPCDSTHFDVSKKQISTSDPQCSEQYRSTSNLQLKSLTFKIHPHMLAKTNYLLCTICNVKVMVNESNMNQHITGYTHTTNFDKFLKDNYIENVNGKFNCKTCAIDNLNDEIAHSKSIEHIKGIQSKKVNTNNEPCLNTIDLNNERKRVTDLPIYLLEKTTNPKEVKCIVCEVKVPNNEGNIKTHLQGMKHSVKYEEFKTKPLNTQNVVVPTIHHHLKYETNHIYCMVCNIEIPSDEKNINDHVKGRMHTAEYNKLLENNYLTNVNGSINCKVCVSNIDLKHDLIHCESIEHAKKLEKYKADSTKNIELSKEVTLNNNLTKANTPPTFNNVPLYLLHKTVNEQEVICRVCKQTVKENNVSEHLTGLDHCKKYKNFLIDCCIDEIGKKYKCLVCNLILEKGSEYEHVLKSHRYVV